MDGGEGQAAEVHEGGADDPVASLGPRMRALRRKQGLTLAQLAERAGLSIGHVSQVERGLSTPTIRQLQAISLAMGVRIGWFFQQGDPAVDDGVVVRADRRRALRIDGLGLTDYLLSPNLEGALELLLCVFEPGAGSGPGAGSREDAYTHEGEEAGMVLSGQLELWVDGRDYLLEEGDSFAFPSTLPHRYRNPGATQARVIWAITPPSY